MQWPCYGIVPWYVKAQKVYYAMVMEWCGMVLVWYTIQQYNIFYLNTVKVKAYEAYGAVLQC